MSGREHALWNEIRPKLLKVPGTDLCRIENGIVPGTPDVNGCIHRTDFWCELKCIEGYPKDPEKPVRIDHYTQQQRLWIRRRGRAGGRVSLLLKVLWPQEYMLFQWPACFHVVGLVPRESLCSAALVWGGPKFPLEPFITGLLMPPPLDDSDYNATR